MGAGGFAAGALLTRTAGPFLPRGGVSEAKQLVQFELSPPSGLRFSSSLHSSVPALPMALSPDGKKLAYVVENGGSTMLWIRSLDDQKERPLPSTEGVHCAFWSPDGQSLGFLAKNSLMRIDISGGPAITLAEASVDPRGGAWLASGVIVYAVSNRDGLRRIPADGGQATPVFSGEDADDKTCWWPTPLPGGTGLPVLQPDEKGLYLGSIDGKPIRRVMATDWAAQYAGSGKLLFLRGQVLFAQTFDESTGQLHGEPQVIAEGVGGSPNGMSSFCGFSIWGSRSLPHLVGDEPHRLVRPARGSGWTP